MNVILSSGGSTILYVELLNEKGENQPYSHRFLPFSISPPRYRTETCFKDKLGTRIIGVLSRIMMTETKFGIRVASYTLEIKKCNYNLIIIPNTLY